MFRGLYNHILDEKGRVSFPGELKNTLLEMGGNDSFILTESLYEPCLVAMTEEEFESQAAKICALPASNPAVIEFKRVVIASSFITQIDKAGRILVPREHRTYAGLEREVVFAGIIDKIEIWSKARWDERNAKRLQDPIGLDALRETLEGFGL